MESEPKDTLFEDITKDYTQWLIDRDELWIHLQELDEKIGELDLKICRLEKEH